jgi:transcriptional regulator with XRE-family HTH domain
LSQRALAALAGVPQSHISKIEKGDVDLRLSSLVEIARVLDLEVTLVPRKNLSAVHSIMRDTRTGRFLEEGASAAKELQQLKNTLTDIANRYPDLKEVAQLQRRVRELAHFPLPRSYVDRLLDADRALRSFSRSGTNHAALKTALAVIQDMRNALAHSPMVTIEPTKPAYSLEEDEDG